MNDITWDDILRKIEQDLINRLRKEHVPNTTYIEVHLHSIHKKALKNWCGGLWIHKNEDGTFQKRARTEKITTFAIMGNLFHIKWRERVEYNQIQVLYCI